MTTRARWLLAGIVILGVGWLAWDAWTTHPVGRWFDRAGEPVPDGTLSVYVGSDHCGWTNTTFIQIDLPLVDPTYEDNHGVYIWKTGADDYPWHGVAVTPRYVSAMPPDARDTGLHRGQLSLWVSRTNLDRAVFVTDGEMIQRWAFSSDPTGCA